MDFLYSAEGLYLRVWSGELILKCGTTEVSPIYNLHTLQLILQITLDALQNSIKFISSII